MDLSRRNVLLLLFSLAGAYTSWAATVEVPSSSTSPLAVAAAAYENLFDTTKDLFAILTGPGVINTSAPEQLHKLFDAVDDVTLAALKADQTAQLSSISINEEQLKKNIYSALLAAEGRMARELIGKLVAFHVLGRGGEDRAKRSAALRQFFKELAEKEKLASHGRFVESVVEVFGAARLGSLAFAIDTTGSMGEDIATVVYLTKSITTSTEDAATSYVLAPFNDPGNTKSMKTHATVVIIIIWLQLYRQLSGLTQMCPAQKVSFPC